MATGAIVGGLLGGALGGIPSLGMGTGMGYALGSGIGGVVEGQALWGKAQNKQIPETDPRMALLFNEIRQKKAGLESGQFYQPQQDMIRQAGAQALGTAAGITGGDIGATVSALGAINRGTGRNLNELYGGMMNQSLNMGQQEQAIAQYLAGMRYQSRAYEQQQAMAHAAQTLQNGMQNLNAAVASGGLDGLGIGGNGGNNTIPSATPSVNAPYNAGAAPWNQAINSWIPIQSPSNTVGVPFAPPAQGVSNTIGQTQFGSFGNTTNTSPGFNSPFQQLSNFNNMAAQNNSQNQNILLSLLRNQMATPAVLSRMQQRPVGFGNMGNQYVAPFQNIL